MSLGEYSENAWCSVPNYASHGCFPHCILATIPYRLASAPCTDCLHNHQYGASHVDDIPTSTICINSSSTVSSGKPAEALERRSSAHRRMPASSESESASCRCQSLLYRSSSTSGRSSWAKQERSAENPGLTFS